MRGRSIYVLPLTSVGGSRPVKQQICLGLNFSNIIHTYMNGCEYLAHRTPFECPSGTSFCFYYVVFCRNDIDVCPFSFKPHHQVSLNEFEVYPANGFQLSLFDD